MALENKKYMGYDRFHGNGLWQKINHERTNQNARIYLNNKALKSCIFRLKCRNWQLSLLLWQNMQYFIYTGSLRYIQTSVMIDGHQSVRAEYGGRDYMNSGSPAGPSELSFLKGIKGG